MYKCNPKFPVLPRFPTLEEWPVHYRPRSFWWRKRTWSPHRRMRHGDAVPYWSLFHARLEFHVTRITMKKIVTRRPLPCGWVSYTSPSKQCLGRIPLESDNVLINTRGEASYILVYHRWQSSEHHDEPSLGVLVLSMDALANVTTPASPTSPVNRCLSSLEAHRSLTAGFVTRFMTRQRYADRTCLNKSWKTWWLSGLIIMLLLGSRTRSEFSRGHKNDITRENDVSR